jgi:hypothetical protein
MTQFDSKRRRVFVAIMLGSLLGALAHPVLQASAAAEEQPGRPSLASLVPADAGLAVEVRDFARHARELKDGPWYARLEPLVTRLIGERREHFTRVAGQLEKQLGVSADDLFMKLLGHDVLFAVWPARQRDGDGIALLVFRTPDAELLAKVFEGIVSAQQKAGKLREARSVEYAGKRYAIQAIQGNPGHADSCMAIDGEFGFLSSSDKILEQVLKAHAGAGGKDSLAALAAYREGMERLAPGAMLRAFLNTRPWDEQMSAEQDGARPDLVKQQILGIWKASQYAAASLDLGEDLSLEAWLRWDGQALPPTLRHSVECLAGTTEAVEHVPADALVAVATRLDLAKLTRTLLIPQQSAERRSVVRPGDVNLGWVAMMTIASGLGPNLSACLVPGDRASGEAGQALDWFIGVESQPLEAGEHQPPLSQTLDPLVRRGLEIAAASYNARRPKEPALVETSVVDSLAVTTVSGISELGESGRIAFASAGKTVIVGSSEPELRKLVKAPPAESLAQQPRFTKTLNPRIGQPGHLLYLDAAGLRELIVKEPRALNVFPAMRRLDPVAAQAARSGLVGLLKAADSMLAEGKLTAEGLAIGVRMRLD